MLTLCKRKRFNRKENQTIGANSFSSLSSSVIIKGHKTNNGFKNHIGNLGYRWEELTPDTPPIYLGEAKIKKVYLGNTSVKVNYDFLKNSF